MQVRTRRGRTGRSTWLVAGIAAVLVAATPVPTSLDTTSTEDVASLLGSASSVRLIVTADDDQEARETVLAADLPVLVALPGADAVVTVAGSAGIARLRDDTRVRGLTVDEPLRLTTNVSQKVTRAEDVVRTMTTRRTKQPLDGSGVTVAVIDSGVDGTHPMLTRADGSSVVVRNLRSVCDDDLTTAVGAADLADTCFVAVPSNDSDTLAASGHGTHVTSILAGQPYQVHNGRVLGGAAPGASIVALSVGTTVSISSSLLAMQWVLDHHEDPCGDGSCPPIRVTNHSYASSDERHDPDSPVARMTDALVAEGITTVWGADNQGGDGSTVQTNPYGQNPTPGVIMVAATDHGNYAADTTWRRDGEVASFSSRGLRGDPQTYPDIAAPGNQITAACRPWLALCQLDEFAADPNVGTLFGTSMAAPHVAGIAALLLQADPDLTPADVEWILEDTATPIGATSSLESDPFHAGGQTSFDQGHGLVDAAAAVWEVRRGRRAGATCARGDLRWSDATDDQAETVGPAVPQLAEAQDLTEVQMVLADGGLELRWQPRELTPDDELVYVTEWRHDGVVFLVVTRREDGVVTADLAKAGDPSVSVQPVWSDDTRTISVRLTAADIAAVGHPELVAGVRLDAVLARSEAIVPGLFTVVTDMAYSDCPLIVGASS